jgi:predicted transcriptional regulator
MYAMPSDRTAQAIVEYRRKHGVTQRALAPAFGIVPAYLNDIEHGRRRLPDERIKGMTGFADLRAALIKARTAEYRDAIKNLKGEAA